MTSPSLVERRRRLVQINFTVESLAKAERIRLSDVYELQKLLNNEINLSHLTDEQAACFLLSCDNNVEQAVAIIRVHYKQKRKLKCVFTNRTLARPELRTQIQICSRYALLPRTEDNHAVVYHKQQNVGFFNLTDFITLLAMMLDIVIYDNSYDNPPAGLIVLFDMKGVSLLHLMKLRYSIVKNYSIFVQEGLPIKLERVYIFNVPWYIDKFMNFLTPMLNEHMISCLHFFPPGAGLEELHKYFNKAHLPEELGGDLPSYEVLHEKIIEKMEAMESYFDEEEKQWSEQAC